MYCHSITQTIPSVGDLRKTRRVLKECFEVASFLLHQGTKKFANVFISLEICLSILGKFFFDTMKGYSFMGHFLERAA